MYKNRSSILIVPQYPYKERCLRYTQNRLQQNNKLLPLGLWPDLDTSLPLPPIILHLTHAQIYPIQHGHEVGDDVLLGGF